VYAPTVAAASAETTHEAKRENATVGAGTAMRPRTPARCAGYGKRTTRACVSRSVAGRSYLKAELAREEPR